jgi:hypothetical protein
LNRAGGSDGLGGRSGHELAQCAAAHHAARKTSRETNDSGDEPRWAH